MDEKLTVSLHWITRAIEIAGVAAIVIGVIIALMQFLGNRDEDRTQALRSRLGRSILVGLELLVAADIINTVAIEPTLESVAVLAGIVLIRTFLSFSLEVEIEGKWPWQKAQDSSKSD